MFGQQQSTFGSPAPTAFGSPAPTATSGFGSPAPAAFGAPAPATNTGFGGFGAGTPAPAPTNFGFGAAPAATAPSTGGFGAFGSPSPAPAPSTFGAPATPFGAPAPSSGGLFGAAPTPTPVSGGLFGQAPPAASGGFGAPSAPTTGFGGFGQTPNTNPAPAFGAAAPATTAFGAPPPATGGLFGAAPVPVASTFGSSPAPTKSVFGAPTPSTGLFGASPAPVQSGGLFSSAATSIVTTTQPGSSSVPYSMSSKPDGSTTISIHAISAMQAYENKSFEELRCEDYSAGNKGTQGQQQPVGTSVGFGATQTPGGFGAPAVAAAAPFGSPTQTPGLFGATQAAPVPAVGFGVATGGFGAAPTPAPTPALFGAPAVTGFGAPAQAPTSLFGNAPTAPPVSGFGAAPTGGGLFGATPVPTPPAFSINPTPAPAGGLFGAAPVPAAVGLFGAPAAPVAAPGLFGNTAAPTPAPGGLFGAAPAPAPVPTSAVGLFGTAPAPTTTGLFGASPVPATTGLFSPTPAPAATGLFGPTPIPSTNGLFGATAAPPTPGLFGSSPAPISGGMFGAAPAPAPLFGLPTAPPTPNGGILGVAANIPAVIPQVIPDAEALIKQQLAAIDKQKKELALQDTWRGAVPNSPCTFPNSLSELDAAIGFNNANHGRAFSRNSSTYSSSLLSFHTAPRSASKFGRPRGFDSIKSPVSLGRVDRSRGVTNSSFLSPNTYLRSSAKQLVIKPGVLTPKPKMRLLLCNDTALVQESEKLSHNEINHDKVPTRTFNNNEPSIEINEATVQSSNTHNRVEENILDNSSDKEFNLSTSGENIALKGTASASFSEKKDLSSDMNDQAYDFYNEVVDAQSNNDDQSKGVFKEPSNKMKTILPKLTNTGYQISPTLGALALLSEADLATVSNFVIERPGYGSIAWEGAVDIRRIDLDNVVSIEAKDVSVYFAEEKDNTKPVVGTKLNRPALITLHNVFPKKGPNSSDELKEKLSRKIEKSTKLMGAELISFESNSGIWVFRVAHFSRYALDDDTDEENEEEVVTYDHVKSSVGDFVKDISPEIDGSSRFWAPTVDEEMSDKSENNSVALTSETEVGSDDVEDLLKSAEVAYEMILQDDQVPSPVEEQLQLEHSIIDTEVNKKKSFFDEGEIYSEYILPEVTHFPNDMSVPRNTTGICKKIANICGIQSPTSSKTDFGLRLGKSFRVCWRPDGSFLHPTQLSYKKEQKQILIQRRPLFGTNNPGIKSTMGSPPLLSTHLEHSMKTKFVDEFSLFTLPHGIIENNSKGEVKVNSVLEAYRTAGENIMEKNDNFEDIRSVTHAFSLLLTLFGVEQITSLSDEDRQQLRNQSFKKWLCDISSSNVSEEVFRYESQKDFYGAIFAAISGGNNSKASSMAMDNGFPRLAELIANSSLTAGTDLCQQKIIWENSGAVQKFPDGLIRIYSLLSRNSELEDNIFVSKCEQILDWKRRLGILVYCQKDEKSSEGLSLVTHCVSDYRSKIDHNLVPHPYAEYSQFQEKRPYLNVQKCILFRILELFVDWEKSEGKSLNMTNIIDPSGFTSHLHDVSLTFHLAAIFSSLGICKPMSVSQECFLIEGYALQLISCGAWEWAVYIYLCTLTSSKLKISAVKKKKERAFNLIVRYFTDDTSIDQFSQQRRIFLEEKVGIPGSWFEIALAYRYKSKLNPTGYVKHALALSLPDAVETYLEVIVPNLLFEGGDTNCRKVVDFFDAITDLDDVSTSSRMCQLVVSFLKLSKQVQSLCQGGNEEKKKLTEATNSGKLLLDVKDLQNLLLTRESDQKSKATSFPDPVSIPQSVFMAELSASVSLLITQMKALNSGHSILDLDYFQHQSHCKRLKLISQLVFQLSLEGHDTGFAYMKGNLGSESLLRWRYGIK